MTEVTRRLNIFNTAGKERFNPVLQGLGLRFVYIPDPASPPAAVPTAILKPTLAAEDAAEVDLSSTLTPQVVLSGSVGILDAQGRFSDTSVPNWATAGIAAGDFLFLKDTAGNMKTGLYEVADVGTPNVDDLRLLNPYREDGQMLWPFNGAKSNLAWVAAYLLEYDSADGLCQGGVASDILGASYVAVEHEIVFKASSDVLRGRFFVRGAPDEDIIILDGVSWDGFTTTKQDEDRIALNFLRSPLWFGHGGIGVVEIVSSTDFYWDSAHTKQGTERIALAKVMGVYVTSGTGSKTGTFRLRSRFGDPNYKDVVVTLTVISASVEQFNVEKF